MDMRGTIERISKTNPSFKAKVKGFTMIPNLFIERIDLSCYEKMICVVIAKHRMNKTTCWPSHQKIADQVGCSVSTVKKLISSLEEKGLLEKSKNKEHKSCVYELRFGLSP